MVSLIDTHAHLDFKDYENNLDEILDEAKKQGVEKIIVPGVTLEDTQRIINLIDKYENLYGAIGLHPSEAKSWDENSYDLLKEHAKHPKVVAIGEIGLDYYWDKTFNDVQKMVFIEQIKLAKELAKPIIIHNRDAHQATYDVLVETDAREVGGVMHCFSGSPEFALQCVKLGFHIALGGPVTFKNAKSPKEVAKIIPLENLLLETDSPFLTPHPHRGKTNYPAFIRLVAEEIAQIRGISLEELANSTSENAVKLFNI